jgi:hypothetical protein
MLRLAGQPVWLSSDSFFDREGRLNRAECFSVLYRRLKTKRFPNI